MRRLLALPVLLLAVPAAHAQCSGIPGANQVCAGASSGAAAPPTFRALVNADVPGGGGSVSSVICGTGLTGGTITTAGTCNVDIASDPNIWGAVANKPVDAGNLNDAGKIVALTDAGTIALDLSTFVNASVTLAGNRVLASPTNTQVGRTGCIYIGQDTSPPRSLTFGANWKFSGGSAPTLTSASLAVDVLCYQVRTSSFIVGTMISNVK